MLLACVDTGELRFGNSRVGNATVKVFDNFLDFGGLFSNENRKLIVLCRHYLAINEFEKQRYGRGAT